MNTLNLTELAAVTGGFGADDIEWTYELLMHQLQQQADEAQRKAWQEFMASHAA